MTGMAWDGAPVGDELATSSSNFDGCQGWNRPLSRCNRRVLLLGGQTTWDSQPIKLYCKSQCYLQASNNNLRGPSSDFFKSPWTPQTTDSLSSAITTCQATPSFWQDCTTWKTAPASETGVDKLSFLPQKPQRDANCQP